MGQQDLQAFLEDAFDSIQPTSPAIGQGQVDPNYTVAADVSDRGGLAAELVRLIQDHTPDVASPQGHIIRLPMRYPLLDKYLSSITLRRDRGLGSWVQVEPSGGPLGIP